MYRVVIFLLSIYLLQPLAAERHELPSEVHENAVPSLVNLTSMPSAMVNGCVNVITGDLCILDQDDIVSGGPDPYILGHSYCSSSLEEGNLGDGWNFLHHHFLEVYQPGRISYVKKDLDFDTPYLYPIEMTDFYQQHMGNKTTFGGDALEFLSLGDSSLTYDDEPLSSFSDNSAWTDACSSSHALELFSQPVHPLDLLHGRLVEKGSRPNDTIMSGYEDPIFLSLFEPSGGRLLYKTVFDEEYAEKSLRHFELVTKNSGFTNISQGMMSAHSNIKNISVKWNKKEDRFTATLGDGTRRIYERQWKHKDMKHKRGHHATYYRDYQLYKEKKPNGNYTLYEYNNKFEITKVRAYNKDNQLMHWVEFNQKKPGDFAKRPSLHVKTSDGKELVYRFERVNGSHMHGTYCVSEIERPGYPKTAFTYSDKDHNHKIRVKGQRSEDGFYIKTKYYREKRNDMGSHYVKPSHSKGKFLRNRVRMQLAPVGPNGDEITTHKYYYYRDGEEGSGHTTVSDAYANKTRYRWNKDKRLTHISCFDNQKKRLKTEEFCWGKKGTDNEGRLRAYILRDENNKALLVHKYSYDARGNVTEDMLLARITEGSGDVKFNKKNLRHYETCDKSITTYTYSKDTFNLKESECDPLGNYTYYSYKPGTNLLEATYICAGKDIKKREFFEYDASGILVLHTVDDGRSKDINDLKGATERHITRITPRYESPHFGEPQQIDEFHYDFKNNKRKWFKKVVNYFNEKGHIVKKECQAKGENSVWYAYAYDEAGRITYSEDPEGRIETYTYDKAGHLIHKTGPRDDATQDYIYDKAGRLIKEIENQPDGLILTTEYGYDNLSRKTWVKNPQGNVTNYTYDALNRVTSITYPDIYDHQGNKKTPKKTYSYEQLGTIVTEKDELGQISKTTYNALGKICSQTLPDGTTLSYFYDLKGNCIKEVSPNGAETHLSYDAFNRLTKSRVKAAEKTLSKRKTIYNSFHPIKEIGPTEETVTYAYDIAGRKISQQQDERKTLFTYNYNNLLRKEKTSLDNDGFIAKTYRYDALQRLTSETLSDHKQKVRTFIAYGYDAEDNLTTTTQNIDGQEAITDTRYHPHSLPALQTNAEGHQTLHKYYHNHINEYGQTVVRKETIDARGCTLEEIFDTRGNLSKVSRFDPTHALIAKKELYYDKLNHCIRIHESAISQSEIKTIITLFEYTNNHLTAITEAHGTPEEKTTKYIYNRRGQLETIIHADNTILNHRYDTKGRLSHFYSSDYTIDYSYYYDASDRLLEVTNNSTGKKTTRTYNKHGELTSETLETGLTLTYSYDNAGRVKELTLPDGSKVAYNYSAYLDSIHRLNPQGEELYKHEILERDLSGFTKKTALAASCGTLTFNRDKLGRNTNIFHAQFEQKATSFDPVGNLLSLHTKDPEGSSDRTFTYDFLSQLTSETGPTSHSYNYDSLYNRLKKDEAAYTVNDLHSVLSDSNHSYSYDKRGNRLSQDNITYKYDALDRLTEVIDNNVRYTYSYDAFNRRLKKEISTFGYIAWNSPEISQLYLYAPESEIGALNSSNNITELRILGEGLGAEIGASIALELNGTTYIPLHDRQGNITLLLDSNAAPIETYHYDAFGQETTPEVPKSPWRFSSKRVDPETGLVYFGRRYYDPTLGKWLTQDPLGLKAGPNLYAYVLNGPMTKFDLYGLNTSQQARQGIFGIMGIIFVDEQEESSQEITIHALTDPHQILTNIIADVQRITGKGVSTDELMCLGKEMIEDYRSPGIPGKALGVIIARNTIQRSPILKRITSFVKELFKANPTTPESSLPKNIVQKNITTHVPQNVSPHAPPPTPPKQHVDFIAGENGVILPKSRSVMQNGFQKAGFPSSPTRSPGVQYELPGMNVRVMEPSGPAPLRASFEHPKGGHINPITGKPVQPKKGLTKEQNRINERQQTHLDLEP